MGIYSAPSMSFIDTYMNAAKNRDARVAEQNRQLQEGMDNLVKAGANAYLFNKREDMLNKMLNLDDEEARLRNELNMLTGATAGIGSRSNFDAIMNGMDYNLMPRVYKGGGLF